MESFSKHEFNTVVIGGTILSSIAGCINASVLTGNIHVTISHVTGNMTRLGSSVVQGVWSAAGSVAGFTVCFFMGSLASGLLMDSAKFQLGRSYGIALLVEACVLVLSWGMMHFDHPVYGAASAAFACGLQNAFCTGYSGAVLRTTHMTGITTDIGIICGQVLAQNPRADVWKLRVFVPLWLGYLAGAGFGTWASLALAHHAILIPAAVLCVSAVFYLTWGPARHARERMLVAVKKVQIELEAGISKTVDAVVDSVDGVAQFIPWQLLQKQQGYGRNPQSFSGMGNGFHSITVPASSPTSPIAVKPRSDWTEDGMKGAISVDTQLIARSSSRDDGQDYDDERASMLGHKSPTCQT